MSRMIKKTIRFPEETVGLITGYAAENNTTWGKAARVIVEAGLNSIRNGEQLSMDRRERVRERLLIETVMIQRHMAHKAGGELLKKAQEDARQYLKMFREGC